MLTERTPRFEAVAAALLLAVVMAVATPTAALAQSGDASPLYLAASPDDGTLRIQVAGLFPPEGSFASALHSGLPLRIRILCELWKDGFFDSQRGRAEWRASVVFDPLDRRYRINTGGAGTPEIQVDSLDQVEDVLEDEFGLPLRPDEDGRWYYQGFVEVETLSVSDLEELQRWLRGDPAPAAGRREDEGDNAVGRGLRSVLVRMLGLPARRFRVRSPTFDFRPGRPN